MSLECLEEDIINIGIDDIYKKQGEGKNEDVDDKYDDDNDGKNDEIKDDNHDLFASILLDIHSSASGKEDSQVFHSMYVNV